MIYFISLSPSVPTSLLLLPLFHSLSLARSLGGGTVRLYSERLRGRAPGTKPLINSEHSVSE